MKSYNYWWILMDESLSICDREEKLQTKVKVGKYLWTKDRIILAIIFMIIFLISIALLVIILLDDTFLFEVVRNYFIRPIVSLHIALQVFLFLLLMIIQSLLVPIPSELILLSGALIFGLWWGVLLGVIGSMLSAAVTYYLAKRGARSIIDAAGKKSGIIDRTISIFDIWIKKWGLWAIIVGRAVPVIMFDPISYAAGVSNVKDRDYFIATFIGSIPRTIFYGLLGVNLIKNQPIEYILGLSAEEIHEYASQFNYIFFIIFGVLIFMFILANVIYYVREYQKKKQKNTSKESDNEIEINSTSTSTSYDSNNSNSD